MKTTNAQNELSRFFQDATIGPSANPAIIARPQMVKNLKVNMVVIFARRT